MSADAHLSRQQFFFHGTNADLNPGDLIHSAAQRGTDSTLSRGRDQHTYMTADPNVAERYAGYATIGDEHRGFVYTVRPLGRISPDPKHSASAQGYRSKGPLQVVAKHERGNLEVERPWWR